LDDLEMKVIPWSLMPNAAMRCAAIRHLHKELMKERVFTN